MAVIAETNSGVFGYSVTPLVTIAHPFKLFLARTFGFQERHSSSTLRDDGRIERDFAIMYHWRGKTYMTYAEHWSEKQA